MDQDIKVVTVLATAIACASVAIFTGHSQKTNAMRQTVEQQRKFKYERLESFVKRAETYIDTLNLKSASSPEFRESLHAAKRFDKDVIGFLEVEFPAEVSPYMNGNGPPQGSKGAQASIDYYESRSKALKEIMIKVKK